MDENKTILALIAIALAVTIAGTLVSVSKLSSLGGKYTFISGAASSDSGTATMTVTSVTSITTGISLINFGTGKVNESCSVCELNSTHKDRTNDPCCNGFTDVDDPFVIENTGNTNVSLNFTCAGACTWQQFVNGTDGAYNFYADYASSWITESSRTTNETSDDDTVASCGAGGAQIQNSAWTAMTPSNWLCGSSATAYELMPTEVKDAVVMHLQVKIPDDASTTSARTSTFTFNAASSG